MTISAKDWSEYIRKLSALSEKAAEEMREYILQNGFADMDAVIAYAYGLATKYGEGAGALAAAMYDAVAELNGKLLDAAEVAETASYNTVAKTVQGVAKKSTNAALMANAVGRLVKRAGAETTLKNAIRDGAEFAWVPHGDTCAFCIMLASRGWQRASKKALKNGHAEHIHSNCDCTYAIRFDGKGGVAGYDPDKYYEEYKAADGSTSKEKVNAMRRENYAENRDKINEQKRAAYAARKETDFYVGKNGKALQTRYKNWIGENEMQKYLDNAKSEEAKRYIRADFRKASFVGDGSTAAIRKFEKETGINCGRNGGNHAQKVEDLIRQIEKCMLKEMPESDKMMLSKMLDRLKKVK